MANGKGLPPVGNDILGLFSSVSRSPHHRGESVDSDMHIVEPAKLGNLGDISLPNLQGPKASGFYFLLAKVQQARDNHHTTRQCHRPQLASAVTVSSSIVDSWHREGKFRSVIGMQRNCKEEILQIHDEDRLICGKHGGQRSTSLRHPHAFHHGIDLSEVL
ncbi:hypothetical protein DUI87_12733 [Hirundo rustica rustica]|uniref:Uncharacterized protein n=1 Tax=Hirundo rustica rustica TaxID=333673 RepID=A0A3M0K9U0_HIRRU|nr:hypothetical protein DUI87_12733 [Hirundo rustica rustica]